MKRLIFFLITFTVISNTYGQKPKYYDNLAGKYPEKDYIILNKSDATQLKLKKDSIVYVQKRENKIYYTSDKSGIYYQNSVETSYFRELIDIRAYSLTRQQNKNKYKKYKVKKFDTRKSISNSIFYDDIILTSFDYENLKKGSISYQSHTVKYSLPQFPVVFYFANSTPVLESEFLITADNNIDLNIMYINMKEEDVLYSKKRKKRSTIHSWKLNNIEPYKDEEASPDLRYHMPHIIISIKSYTTKGGKTTNVMRDVTDLYAWYYSLLQKVKVENTEEIQVVLDAIVNKEDEEVVKVKKIFSWVQSNIKYIAIADGLGGFVPRNPDVIMKSRYGDCKDMSTLIVTMLELSGIEANLAWVGTRELPYKYNEVPSPMVDNHMIAVYKDKTAGKYLFLDATNPSIGFGMPTEFIQGKEALISDKEEYFIETVPIVEASKNSFSDSIFLKIENNMLYGTGKLSLKGYFDSKNRNRIEQAGNEQAIKNIVNSATNKGSNKYQVNNYTIQKNEDEIVYLYDFELDRYLKQNNDELYVNMNLDKSLDNSKPFKDDRVLPVENDFRKTVKLYFSLEIPEGYSVKFIPSDANYYNEKFSYDIKYEQKGNKLIYEYKLVLNYLILDVDEQKKFNEMLKSLKNSYKDNLILTKVK